MGDDSGRQHTGLRSSTAERQTEIGLAVGGQGRGTARPSRGLFSQGDGSGVGWCGVGRHACVKDKGMEKKVFGGGRGGEAERPRENVWVRV